MSRELFHEISRRDFLKLCATVTAALGLSEGFIPQVAEALAASAAKPPLLWLEMGSCSGCSTSFLNSDAPDIANVVLNILSVRYHETIMAAQGKMAEKVIEDTVKNEAGKYIVVIEGVIPTKPGYGMIAGKQMVDVLEEVSGKALAVLAVGSCASFGGIPGASPNPGGVKPVSEIIGKEKVVNLPGCPANPIWLLSTVTNYLLYKSLPRLDRYGRPLFIYGQSVHDNCPRRASFDEGRYVEKFGQPEEKADYCLVKMGCKGPETYSNCPQVRWNSGKNWCIGSGAGCIGCVEPNWPDQFSPFYDRLPDIKLGGVRATADTVGAVLGAATVIGLGAHAVVSVAQGKGFGRQEAEKKTAKSE